MGLRADDWSVAETGDGSWTLVHPGHGEACHSRAGAWHEARERYARACRLARAGERASRGGRAVRLLDVGTGLGLNLAAALEALAPSGAPLLARTLELERSAVERTLAERPRRPVPPDVEPWWGAVASALEQALAAPAREVPLVVGGRSAGSLRLLLGDARATLPALGEPEPFEAVFLDPFSPRADPALWEPAFLAEVARRLAPGGWLSTYTVSLAARAGLVAAGLRVGPGPRVGTKASGTLARRGADAGELPPRVRRRVERRARSLGLAGRDAPDEPRRPA